MASTSLRDDGRAIVEDTGLGLVVIANRGDDAGALLTEERFGSFADAERWTDENLPRGPITYPVG